MQPISDTVKSSRVKSKNQEFALVIRTFRLNFVTVRTVFIYDKQRCRIPRYCDSSSRRWRGCLRGRKVDLRAADYIDGRCIDRTIKQTTKQRLFVPSRRSLRSNIKNLKIDCRILLSTYTRPMN